MKEAGMWVFLIFILIGAVILEWVMQKKRERDFQARLKRMYGRSRKEKYLEPERLKEIGLYDRMTGSKPMGSKPAESKSTVNKPAGNKQTGNGKRPGEARVDDVTWRDLDMDSVFKEMNHTVSFVGEQVLYSRLHRLSTGGDRRELDCLEYFIRLFDGSSEMREQAWKYLSRLGKDTVNYYIPQYLSLLKMQRFPALGLCKVLLASLILLGAAVLLTGHPLAVGAAIINLLGNMAFYAVEKIKYEAYLSSMGGMVGIVRTAEKLLQLLEDYYRGGGGEPPENIRTILLRAGENLKELKKLSGMMAGLGNKKAAGMSGDVFAMIWDYLTGAFMLDFMIYDRIVTLMEGKAGEFLEVYDFVGEMDMAIAVASWRKSLDGYCEPEFMDGYCGPEILDSCREPEYLMKGKHRIMMEDIRHPLVKGAVGNSLDMQRNILLTGSNASGKSTFVKAVAINLILAQTVHCCTARRLVMPGMAVLTSMAVRDDILSGESYYMREIRYLKRMIDRMTETQAEPAFLAIDEILRGTNTVERIAASRAILKYLQKQNCFVMAATHDLELARDLDGEFDNFHFCSTMGKDIVFDYRLHRGICSTQNAIRLLAAMGFPREIIDDSLKGAAELSSPAEKEAFREIIDDSPEGGVFDAYR